MFIHSRLLRPLLGLTLMFLSLPLVLGGDGRNMFINLGLSLATSALFYGACFVTKYLGEHEALSPELSAWAPPRLTVRVACGKGTYVRSLAHDLGRALGPGAHLEALRRTRVGLFRQEDAVPWDVLRQADLALLVPHLRPADRAVAHLPAVPLSAAAALRLRHGQTLGPDVPSAAGLVGVCRLYADETFLGVGEAGPRGLRALRLLPLGGHADRPGTRPVSS